MSGLYPPGVSGDEFQIVGPDYEREGRHYCDNCDKRTEGLFQGYSDRHWFLCDECGETTEIEADENAYYYRALKELDDD